MIDNLIKIIKEASIIFKEGYFETKDITFKDKKDLVTQYDVAVETYLKKHFTNEFPEFNIIAEESNNENIEFNNSIIIDPIDGTTNFVNKLPHCAISVGVYKEKKPYIGVVYNPILDDIYIAQVGKGAYCNGMKIEVSKDTEFQKALISTGFPYTSSSSEKDLNFVLKNMKSILPKCQDIRRLGSAALDLCMVANGTFEGYYEINLKAWDKSAGMIILSEAGGKITNISGNKHDMFSDECIVASNGYIHEEFLEFLED
jgi:myo-inositol-1(or 4)-monophosphatase